MCKGPVILMSDSKNAAVEYRFKTVRETLISLGVALLVITAALTGACRIGPMSVEERQQLDASLKAQQQAHDGLVQVLVRSGYCRYVEDTAVLPLRMVDTCNGQIFYSSSSSGVGFGIYHVDDQAVLEKLRLVMQKTFDNNPSVSHMLLTVYKLPYERHFNPKTLVLDLHR